VKGGWRSPGVRHGGRGIRSADGRDEGRVHGHRAPVTRPRRPVLEADRVGDAAGVVRLWDAGTRREQAKIEVRGVASTRFSSARRGHIAVGDADRVLSVFRVETLGKMFDITLPSSGDSEVLFSPDGERVTIVMRESEWDGRELKSVLTIREHDLLSGRAPKKRQWNRRDGSRTRIPTPGLRVDAAARRAALLDEDEVLIWAIDEDREVARLDGSADAVAWRKDGKLMVSRASALELVNAESGRVEKKYAGGGHEGDDRERGRPVVVGIATGSPGCGSWRPGATRRILGRRSTSRRASRCCSCATGRGG